MNNNIFLLENKKIQNIISDKDISICVVGIGRIGLPTALAFADKNFRTIGVDTNRKLIKIIKSRKYPLKDEPGFEKIFGKAIQNKKFQATSDLSVASNYDIIILSLPTPTSEKGIPDYSVLLSVGRKLNKVLAPNSIVIVESTVEPGFIEKELIPLIEGNKKRLKIGINLGIVSCPETANPGQILKDFKKAPRFIGGSEKKVVKIVSKIYKIVFNSNIILLKDCKTANASKLMTNIFRYVNIGLVNELAMLFEKDGINIWKVIDTCSKKYNFEPHFPGSGVGGPCLPTNSFQMLNYARQNNSELKILKASKDVNSEMPQHTIKLLLDSLKFVGMSINSATISILGISYKPNVKHSQTSPAIKIIEKLKQLKAKVRIYDPYFENEKFLSVKTEKNIFDAVKNSDAIIIVTAHDEFLELEISTLASQMRTPILLDTRGIVNGKKAERAGWIYKGLGYAE